MASKSLGLAQRREALVARCADQRAQVAQEVAMLSSPQTLGLIPAYAARHQKTALIVAGVAAGLFLTKPKWAVGTVTAVVSAYKFAQKLLPVLRWRGFEVH
ncbi:hypothetical protein [Massilia varians]|uniref:hypothetical protein n=1 Tax=Massilia varians TaxID=457921 RepID=UPI00255337EA|nr:hypothetical protein [Massilia varians]MDK6076408.1 hypothetical protein [Massilia varians]